MNFKNFITFFIPFTFITFQSFNSFSQSIQLFTEDFQTGGSNFTLTGSGPGTNTGTNQWIVNNQYSGVPSYPNTMGEDSTFGGTIGFAPHSQYLHIYDAPSGITNCNYNPTVQSDHFAYMSNGICTFGIDSVHFSFFYLCQGSATAYGKAYYSINNGPWIQTGQSKYYNKYKWQYEDITSPAFSNVGNLRFGFRWENDNGTAVDSVAFAVDDIDIIGFYDAIYTPTSIIVDNVTPSPVCQGGTITINYHLSDTLCDGSYLIELSNSSGTFPGMYPTWTTNINYPQISGSQTIILPSTIAASGCYKIRINRTSPQPAITGTASACFSVIVCPNVISTSKPAVTFDTNAVCIGSVIDIPFTSTGVYTVNTYTAQLSDSNGTFPTTPTVVGSYFNSGTYDPALGSAPGSVPGLIPNVPPGCNYYIRVVSSNPSSIGSTWGPLCVGQCDITTNNTNDLSFCVTDCAASPLGANSSITINVGNSGVTYYPGNVFSTQLLNNQSFSQLGSNGILGSVAATNDTTLNIHIPCKDSLSLIGVPVGISYLRIIATNSSLPDNSLGSLIRLTVGATRANAELITSYEYPSFSPQDTFCSNDIAASYFSPFNYFDFSTYLWSVNGINGGLPFVSPDGPNSSSLLLIIGGSSVLTIKVQETSYGCVGPWSPIKTIVGLAPPVIPITGPFNVCQGDTVQYLVPFSNNTYYNWTANNASIIDTSNNQIQVSYPNTGIYQITMHAINQCGSVTSNKPIQVNAYPIISGGIDQTVCSGTSVTLSGSGANSYSWDNNVINGSSFIPVVGTITYTVIGTTSGCSDTDKVVVNVNALPTINAGLDRTVCAGTAVTLSGSGASSYTWNNGVINGTPFTPTSTTTYTVTGTDSNGCSNTDQVVVTVNALPTPVITGSLSYCTGFSTTLGTGVFSSYLWSTTATTQNINATIANNPVTVTVTDTNGCTGASPNSNVVENALPTPVITGSLSYCTGFSTTLDAGIYSSYLWSTAAPTQTIIATTANNPISVTVTDTHGCSGTSPNVNVFESANLNPVITGTLSYCVGSNTTLNAGTGYTTYNWSTGSIIQSAIATIANNPISVTVTDANGCTGISLNVNVTQNALPTPAITGALSYCVGSNTTLNADIGYTTYNWSTGSTSQDATATTANNPITITVTDANGCVGTSSSINVTETTLPSVTAGADQSVCKGTTVTLSGTGATSYIWSNGQTTNTISVSPNMTTTYTVTASNNCGTASAKVVVSVIQLIANAGKDTTIINGQSIQLIGNGGSFYTWNPSTGLSCSDCPSPIASPLVTITYTLDVTDANGCSSADTLIVNVMDCGEIFVPNVFSPNTDGQNDMECVYGRCIKSIAFSIYDRWGEKVFETTDPKVCWDGTYKGKLMNTAVFVYYMKAILLSGEEISKKGNITLMR